ncbi:unnamed protein product [Nyctereutes procyonoides]|uniref:(raccoon dog) hypothetical protein n=1 Tax=Nyctereutes procyonoides TaxID=34880 RepID=A0A811ZLD3_NYCPR|nr:unnamed protein product [Nyctereutes procyonoides]
MKREIPLDLFSIPLCEQDQDFLNLVTALDMAMKWMDALHQEKDCGRLQAKVEKFKEKKSGPHWPAWDDFEAKNKQLLHKILLNQVVLQSEMCKIFGDLTQQLGQPGHLDMQWE